MVAYEVWYISGYNMSNIFTASLVNILIYRVGAVMASPHRDIYRSVPDAANRSIAHKMIYSQVHTTQMG